MPGSRMQPVVPKAMYGAMMNPAMNPYMQQQIAAQQAQAQAAAYAAAYHQQMQQQQQYNMLLGWEVWDFWVKATLRMFRKDSPMEGGRNLYETQGCFFWVLKMTPFLKGQDS